MKSIEEITFKEKCVPALRRDEHDAYINIYKCHYNEDGRILAPWACLTMDKFDTELDQDGELVELSTRMVYIKAKDWARVNLGAKFPFDTLRDGAQVSDFMSPGTSANCWISIESFPFYSIRKQESDV